MTARRSVTQRKQKEVEQTRVYGYHELTRRIAFGMGAGYVIAALVVGAGGIEPVWVFLVGVIAMLAIWITGR